MRPSARGLADASDVAGDFIASVAQMLAAYARRVLPARLLHRARRGPPGSVDGALVRNVRFCVPCDADGTPLAAEPLAKALAPQLGPQPATPAQAVALDDVPHDEKGDQPRDRPRR